MPENKFLRSKNEIKELASVIEKANRKAYYTVGAALVLFFFPFDIAALPFASVRGRIRDRIC